MSNRTPLPVPNAKESQLPTLAQYNPKVDLVEVRRDPQKYPRISATPLAEAVAQMTPIVYGAALYRGQEMGAAQVRFIANALVSEILADTKFGLRSLSWMEIGMVIRNAVLGGAKEMYGVSVATLYSALVDYAKTEGHDAQTKAYQPSYRPRIDIPEPQEGDYQCDFDL